LTNNDSIIALPGLSVWAPKTFEAYNNGQDVSNGCTDWLTDHKMLPAKVPGARVLTYNWESNYKGPRSSVRFAETANNFLLDLHEERKTVVSQVKVFSPQYGTDVSSGEA
jgi:hypothetical protein